MQAHQPEKTGRDQAGRFLSGTSGNPAGRPRGARNHATRAAEALLDGEIEGLARKAVDLALSGDTTAMRLCFDRVLPPRRGRPVEIDLGPVESAHDIANALASVLKATASGQLTPEEADAICRIIETTRRAYETQELERRVEALEAASDAR